MQLVHIADSLLEWSGVVGGMQIKDIDLLCLQRLQRFVKDWLEVCTMGRWFGGEDLGRDLESIQVQQSQCLEEFRLRD